MTAGMRAARRFWSFLLLPGGALLLLLFVVPLGMLAVYSFGTPDVVGKPQVGFTLDNYAQVLQSYNLPVLVRTVGYALVATLVCLVLGYAVAYTASRFAGRFGPVIIALMVVPWLVDYLVRIYAWKQLLGDEGLVNGLLGQFGLGPVPLVGTSWAVIGGLVYGYLPLMILPIYAALADLDPALIDAGKDLYGTPRRTFWHVTLPATRQGVLGGCLLVFLPVLGDFATAQFLGGANNTMIGNVIADQFVASGSATFGSALSVTLIAMLGISLLAVRLIGRRKARLLDLVAS